MRKKSIVIIVISIVLGLFFYLSYNVIIKAQYRNKITKQIQTVPKFELLTLERKLFSNSNLKQNLNTVFIYFNSECEFCQHEAENISQNLNKFKNIEFLFVSFEETEQIKSFADLHKLYNQKNVVFLEDKKGVFSSQFNATSIPYVLIYDQNQKLIKKHKGQLNAKGILRALQQND